MTESGPSVFAGTTAELTYLAYEAAVRRGAPVLVPVGVIEQHGPHLPLGTDVYGAMRVCWDVRDALAAAGVEALVAPPAYWGINHVSSAFPGSMRVRASTAAALLEDVVRSLLDDGVSTVLLVNHHGDRAHNEMLRGVVAAVQQDVGPARVRWVESEAMIARLGGSADDPVWIGYEEPAAVQELGWSGTLGVHAHERETALVERWHPELVDEQALAALTPTVLGPDDLAEWRQGGEAARRVTPDGYFGDPHVHDPQLWRAYVLQGEAMAAAIRAAL